MRLNEVINLMVISYFIIYKGLLFQSHEIN